MISRVKSRAIRWLDDVEQTAWRAYYEAYQIVMRDLQADLHASTGLSLAEYDVLVRLMEAPGHRLRMSELASFTVTSRSRISHQISRMEADGLVARESCPTDKRGSLAVLTETGVRRLADAAPHHVASVRQRLLAAYSVEEFAQLGRLSERLLEHLDGGSRDEAVAS